MEKSSKRTRNIFQTSNKYQEKIIFLTVLPSILTFLSFACVIFIADPFISKAIFSNSLMFIENLVHRYCLLIVVLMCVFLILSLMGAYVVSNHMIGAFGRIVSELDEIIAGRSQKTITGRPEDDLTNDLLKRVNVLIKFYVKNRNENPE